VGRAVWAGVQVAAGFFVCASVLMVNVKMDPFLDPVQNILSLFCHLQLTVSLFVGLLLKVGTVNERDSEVMLTLVVVCSAAIVIVPVMEALLYVQELFAGDSHDTWPTSLRAKHSLHAAPRNLCPRRPKREKAVGNGSLFASASGGCLASAAGGWVGGAEGRRLRHADAVRAWSSLTEACVAFGGVRVRSDGRGEVDQEEV
jgi:hypothetical protein